MTGGRHEPQDGEIEPGPGALSVAMDRLGEAIAAEQGEPHFVARALQAAVREVQAVIEGHVMVFEGEEGPLADFVGLKPGLLREVQHRKDEHLELLQRTRAIDESIERALAFDDIDAERLRAEVSVLRDSLLLHLFGARALAYDAYLVDEGGESG